jgi:hypothetical protein
MVNGRRHTLVFDSAPRLVLDPPVRHETRITCGPERESVGQAGQSFLRCFDDLLKFLSQTMQLLSAAIWPGWRKWRCSVCIESAQDSGTVVVVPWQITTYLCKHGYEFLALGAGQLAGDFHLDSA